jgi:hypothetical protein
VTAAALALTSRALIDDEQVSPPKVVIVAPAKQDSSPQPTPVSGMRP